MELGRNPLVASIEKTRGMCPSDEKSSKIIASILPRVSMRVLHGNSVHTEAYTKTRRMNSAPYHEFWCGHSLEHEETIDDLTPT